MGNRVDNKPTFDGLDEEVSRFVDQARGVAFRMLTKEGCVPSVGAVRGLAAVIMVSAAEECAGGNAERPAFKTYSDSLITVAENVGSPFVVRRVPPRG